MIQALLDPEVRRLTGSVHDETAKVAFSAPEEDTLLREWYTTRNDQPDRLDLAVVDRASGACVGEAVLNEWDQQNRSCSFRILLSQAGRGSGLGTGATRLIVGYGFERLGLHRISLEVYSFNPRARRVYGRQVSGPRAPCARPCATAISGSMRPSCRSWTTSGPCTGVSRSSAASWRAQERSPAGGLAGMPGP